MAKEPDGSSPAETHGRSKAAELPVSEVPRDEIGRQRRGGGEQHDVTPKEIDNPALEGRGVIQA